MGAVRGSSAPLLEHPANVGGIYEIDLDERGPRVAPFSRCSFFDATFERCKLVGSVFDRCTPA